MHKLFFKACAVFCMGIPLFFAACEPPEPKPVQLEGIYLAGGFLHTGQVKVIKPSTIPPGAEYSEISYSVTDLGTTNISIDDTGEITAGDKIGEAEITVAVISKEGISYTAVGSFRVGNGEGVLPSNIAALSLPSGSDDYFLCLDGHWTHENLKQLAEKIKSCSATTEGIYLDLSAVEGIATIAQDTFKDCKSLSGVRLPDGLTDTGYRSFYGCTNLTSVILPNSVNRIGAQSFSDCGITSIKIPEDCKYIELNAFSGCSNLTDIEIPDSVTYIGDYAFRGCSSLKSVKLPVGITRIKTDAFYECKSLTSIDIPFGVTHIEESAFSKCTNLETVNLPSSLKEIGKSAFSKCTNLDNLKLPSSLKEIGQDAFDYCTALSSINFDGTTEQWKKVKKDNISGWTGVNGGKGTKVTCSDGEITIFPF